MLAKDLGQVFTPPYIVDLICQNVINLYLQKNQNAKEINIIDPSCGDGAFLDGITRMQQNTNVKLNIYGVDIDSKMVEICQNKGYKNVKLGNALIDNKEICTEAFNWQENFPQVFANGGFDVVVGNPPYVRHELIKAKQKQELSKKYRVHCGGADLYCYFYEKATSILKYEGVLGFITSNKWMRAKYGEKLRKFLLNNIKIETFADLGGQKIFENASVDANILIYTKIQAQNYEFKVLNNLKDYSIFNSNNLSIECFNIQTNNMQRQIKAKMEKIGTPLKDWNVKINYGIKTGYNKAFIIDTATKNKICEEEKSIKINRGILTGFNEAFIIDTKTKEAICKEDANSAEIIKPVLRGRDICRYGYEWAGLWVIFIPWHFPLSKNIEGASKEAEIAFEKQYPAVFKHLLKYKTELSNRNKAETGIRYEWYALQRCAASYYEDFAREKIIYGQFNQGEFAFEDKEVYLSSNEYIIVAKNEDINLKYMLVVLNSKISKFYGSLTMNSLGSVEIIAQKSIFEQLPIPKVDAKTQEPFVKMAEKMLELTAKLNGTSAKFLKLLQADLGVAKATRKLESWHELELAEFFSEISKQNKGLSLSQKSDWADHFETQKSAYKTLQTQISKLDGEINAMVYKLYELTDEEIKIVEL